MRKFIYTSLVLTLGALLWIRHIADWKDGALNLVSVRFARETEGLFRATVQNGSDGTVWIQPGFAVAQVRSEESWSFVPHPDAGFRCGNCMAERVELKSGARHVFTIDHVALSIVEGRSIRVVVPAESMFRKESLLSNDIVVPTRTKG